ncbi:endonuclease/exonuclease/phosphatase family protein [Egicoccus halophilus]|uniref:endonuclease/exonuclease/phosphatase family protein n=1 Tax=Egicoccus halophilus TaxID=1670830 RepID=UPI00102F96C5|nr:endonuclease/exonuclease/phosphatase family protein [Egicoccus halophilus]
MADGGTRDDACGLRLLTLNLWGTNGPVARRMEDLAGWLAASRPDVVALQEVRRFDGELQSDLLAEAAGYPHRWWARTFTRDGEQEGLAVLARRPLTAGETTRLPGHPRDVPRQLQRAEIATPTGPVLVANTHLTWRRRHGGVRLAQARAVRHLLGEESLPVLLVGDLNTTCRSRAVQALAADFPPGSGLTDVFDLAPTRPRATFAFDNPFARQPWLLGRRVDHVLVGAAFEVVDARVVLDGRDGPVVSDHHGVLAELRLPAPDGPADGPGLPPLVA